MILQFILNYGTTILSQWVDNLDLIKASHFSRCSTYWKGLGYQFEYPPNVKDFSLGELVCLVTPCSYDKYTYIIKFRLTLIINYFWKCILWELDYWAHAVNVNLNTLCSANIPKSNIDHRQGWSVLTRKACNVPLTFPHEPVYKISSYPP